MSLLRTAQTSRPGTQRISSSPYSRPHQHGRQPPPSSLGVPTESFDSSNKYSTDDEFQAILRRAANSMLDAESRDPTEDSIPGMSRGSTNSSSTSVSIMRADRRKASPVMGISVGRIEVQKSTSSSNTPPGSPSPRSAAKSKGSSHAKLMVSMAPPAQQVAMAKVDALGQPIPEPKKSEAYERASKLLQKVDASKHAADKVQKAREAAKEAMERARQAREGKSKGTAFSDEAFNLLDDDDDHVSKGSGADRYFIDKGPDDRYSQGDDDGGYPTLDTITDMAAKTLPPSHPGSPKRGGGDMDDIMDFAAGLLGPPKNLDEHYAKLDAEKKKANDDSLITGLVDKETEECVNDACSVWSEELSDGILSCGDDDVQITKSGNIETSLLFGERAVGNDWAGQAKPPTSPRSKVGTPMNPFSEAQPRKHPPSALQDDENSIEEEVFVDKYEASSRITDPTRESSVQHPSGDSQADIESELDDIMNFAAGLLSGSRKRQDKTPKIPPTSGQNAKISDGSIVDKVQSAQAVPKNKSKRKKESVDVFGDGCAADACSVWSDDFFRCPEEEVVFGAGEKRQKVIESEAVENDKVSSLLIAAKKPQATRSSMPPPPEAFNLQAIDSPRREPASPPGHPSSPPVPGIVSSALADDLTEKSSPSVDFPDILAQSAPTEQKQPVASTPKVLPSCGMMVAAFFDGPKPTPCKDKTADQEKNPELPPSEPAQQQTLMTQNIDSLPGQTEEPREKSAMPREPTSREDNKSPKTSDKLSKTTTLLDSNDEYWDTLSSIDSSTKVLSMKRLSHPHPHPHKEHPLPNNEVVVSPESGRKWGPSAAFPPAICSPWAKKDTSRAQKKTSRFDFDEVSLDSSEESLAPEIPREISYPAQVEDVQKGQNDANDALNKVDTLLTRESSSSSESSVSFDMPNKISSFEPGSPSHDLGKAITRGQEMASTTDAKHSSDVEIAPRYGNDEGEEPLGSPALGTHESQSSRATPELPHRKISERRHPWSKRGPVTLPRVKSTTPLIEQEDAELAAMLGIGKQNESKTDRNEVTVETVESVSPVMSEDLSDLIMVLTRSNGDDELFEQGDQIEGSVTTLQFQVSSDDAMSTPLEGEAEAARSSEQSKEFPTGKDKKITQEEGEAMVPVMNDLLAKYDTIIELLLSQKQDGKGKANNSSSSAVEGALVLLRQERERAIAASASKSSPTSQRQEAQPHQGASQGEDTSPQKKVRSSVREEELSPVPSKSPRSGSPPRSPRSQVSFSRTSRHGSPTRSPPRSNSREYESPPRETSSRSRESSSPSQSPVRSNLKSTSREYVSPPLSPGSQDVSSLSREDYASPAQSPVRSDSRCSESKVMSPRPEELFSHSRDQSSPTQSPRRLQTREYDSLELSSESQNLSSRPRENTSPTRSLVRSKLSREFELHSPRSEQVSALSRDGASPKHSPLRSNSRENESPALLSPRSQELSSLSHSRDNTSPTRSPIRSKSSREYESPLPISQDMPLHSREKSSPTRSPVRSRRPEELSSLSRSRDSASPTRSPVRSKSSRDYESPLARSLGMPLCSRENSSPTRSPVRSISIPQSNEYESRAAAQPVSRDLDSRSREYTSTSRSPSKRHDRLSRTSSSPKRSPRRPESISRFRDTVSTRRSSIRPEDRIHSRTSPSQRRTQREYVSPSRSPHRSMQRSDLTFQSRDSSSPVRSAGRQRRTSPSRSPQRPMSSGRSRPRPEEMSYRRRGTRDRSRTPVRSIKDHHYDQEDLDVGASRSFERRGRAGMRHYDQQDLDLGGSRSFERRGRAELREPESAVEVVRRIYSPERRKDRLFVEGDDYAEKSRIVREQLDLARLASQSIRTSHIDLSDELETFKETLSKHSVRRHGERALMTESRETIGDFHHRLQQARKTAGGRESPDTLDAVENALEEAWGDFDNVRSVMMGNLKLLNDAKEELVKERMMREEESDQQQLRELERMMLDIREREHREMDYARHSLGGDRSYAPSLRSRYRH